MSGGLATAAADAGRGPNPARANSEPRGPVPRSTKPLRIAPTPCSPEPTRVTMSEPVDAAARRAVQPVICYPVETLPQPDLGLYARFRARAVRSAEVLVPPREAGTFEVPAGGFFRISSVEGPQVGDLNLWNADDLSERFYSGKTRALSDAKGIGLHAAEAHVHDVLNVFMCTGFTRDTGQYFMKASPVRPGDYLEFFAEIPLLGALSACPGGDCSAKHSSDQATCHPLRVEVFETPAEVLADWRSPPLNGYRRSHGR